MDNEYQEWSHTVDITKYEYNDSKWDAGEEWLEEEPVSPENISFHELNTLITNLITDNEIEELKTVQLISSSETSFDNYEGKKSVNSDSFYSCSEEDFIHLLESKTFDLHNVYPIPNDPGLNTAFWILYPNPPIYKLNGINKFYDIVKILRVAPISSLQYQLVTNKINLSYYGLNSKIIQAISEALLSNNRVQMLDLQENCLTSDACYHLNRLLLRNTVLRSLNLKNCKIREEGAIRLEKGISNSSALRELNLSYCELGNDGFRHIARAVAANTLLQNLDVSYNNLNEGAAIDMKSMLISTDSLKYLNASWNDFYLKEASENVFRGLTENSSLEVVDFSWNSFGKYSAFHVSSYLVNAKKIKSLNLEANRFTGAELVKIAKALLVNSSLETVKLDQNPFESEGISDFIKIINSPKLVDSKLLLIDFGNLWASKDSALLLEEIKERKFDLIIKLGGILENYKLFGPDLKELFFLTANYDAAKAKNKKKQKNFGHFVLSLPDKVIGRENFLKLVKESKIPITRELANEITKQFLVTRKTVDLAALKESYMFYFPDTELPKLPSPKILTTEKSKKKKGKRNKSHKKTKAKKKK